MPATGKKLSSHQHDIAVSSNISSESFNRADRLLTFIQRIKDLDFIRSSRGVANIPKDTEKYPGERQADE